MSVAWIIPDRVFDGATIHEGLGVSIENGEVTALCPVGNIPEQASCTKLSGLLAPGFFDIQVNGGGGALVNDTPTAEALQTIAAAHRKFGTVGILPTVITDAPDVLEAAADALLSLIHAQGIYGLHIEGPHLALSRRGTHAPEHIRPFDDLTLDTVALLRDAGWPVLITVAPEATPVDVVAELVEMGAVVSLGHSAATYDETRAMLAAGACCFTHLFNAMPPMENRAPGIVGAAIESSAWCGIIADCVHVHPSMVMLACNARPMANRMIAVSDAMATVGGPDEFVLYGQTIRRDANRLVNAEGSLAGAHLTLDEALRNLISFGIAPEQALRMCRQNPLELMQIEQGEGIVGVPIEDLIQLDDDFHLGGVGLQAIRSSP